MVRSVFGKVMWVGRATVFLVGLAVVLALVFGVTTAAFAALSKPGDPFKLGVVNEINRLTTLVGAKAGAMLKVDNNGTGPALQLEAGAGKPPLVVKANSGTATNFSADRLDGMDSSQLAPRGYAQVRPDDTPTNADLWVPVRSKGVIGIERKVASNSNPAGKESVYCFDLTFTPHTAMGSAFFNNNAVVATATPSDMSHTPCIAPFNDAAARVFAADGNHDDVGFSIAFM